jgi:hypothetical protein
MTYVMRNVSGQIVAILSENIDGAEEVGIHDSELKEFLTRETPEEIAYKELRESDMSLIRVIEDLIDVLINNGAISFNDFPQPVQHKLLGRLGLRNRFSYVGEVFNPQNDIFTPSSYDEFEGII